MEVNSNRVLNRDRNVVLIAAVSQNGVIGVEGKIPWNLPEYEQRFETLTRGYPVIRGRVSYESMLKNKPFQSLSGRLNLVLSNSTSFRDNGVYVAHSLEDALEVFGDRRILSNESSNNIDFSTVFIAGGEDVYKAAMPYATRLEITLVHQAVLYGKEMRYFPKIDLTQWEKQNRKVGRGYSFVTYERITAPRLLISQPEDLEN